MSASQRNFGQANFTALWQWPPCTLFAIRVARSHLGNRLAGLHAIAFLDQTLAVVTVRRQERRVVLDDDELAVADQTVAAVHDRSIGGGTHRRTGGAGDVDALPYRIAGDVGANDLAVRRPAPADVAVDGCGIGRC